MEPLAGERVLVTGAAGFLGAHLCTLLKQQSCVLFGLDRDAAGSPGLFDRFVVGELAPTAASCIGELAPTVIFHLAGAASVPASVRDPMGDFQTTIPGTAALLAAAARCALPPTLVYYSSAAVYGEPDGLPIGEGAPVRPISPYGAHKAACEALFEHYARMHGLRVRILRIFSAYGEGLRRQFFWDVAGRALAAKAAGERRVRLHGTGEESRDFIHAADVARAACLAAVAPKDGVYNVAAGEETTIAWAAQRLLRSLGLDLAVEFEGAAVPGQPVRWRADTRRLAGLGFELSGSLADRLPALAAWLAAEHARV